MDGQVAKGGGLENMVKDEFSSEVEKMSADTIRNVCKAKVWENKMVFWLACRWKEQVVMEEFNRDKCDCAQ